VSEERTQSEGTQRPKGPGCGCVLLAILPLAILLVFFLVVILRAVMQAG